VSTFQRIRRLRMARLRSRGQPLSRVTTVLLAVVALGIGIVGAAGVYGLQQYNEYTSNVVPPEQLLAQLPHGGARIYDRNGVLLYEFLDEFGGLRRPVPLDQISPYMREATVSTEDTTFYENNGLNTSGLIRAAVVNLTPFGGQFFDSTGGSSITQQLAKQVYIPMKQRYERSVTRKLREAVIALELTKRYPKDQILEWYLNSISYGSVYVGIEAASQGYFAKDAKDLTLAEAALLAGIPQSPAAYEPGSHLDAAKVRQAEVLTLMVRHGAITREQADAAKAEKIVLHASRFDIIAPHFVLGPVASEITQRFGERALYENGLEVTTTLDSRLQKEGETAIETNVAAHEADVNGHNGALIALDPKNGQVLAYVGSRDYFRDDIQGRNDNVSALNSPGSTLKPFTYLTAFQQGWSPQTGIIDAPTKVFDPSTGKDFTPTNPGGGKLHGLITVAEALGNSLNLPAFKTVVAVGVDKVLANYKAFGLTHLGPPSNYGPSLTLGGVDTRLDDVAYAYSALATGGVLRGQQPLNPHAAGERTVDPVVLLKVKDADGKTLLETKQPVERRVMDTSYAYLTTSVISNPENTCITFGCGALELPDKRPVAKKSGTSEPFENQGTKAADTWTFGYTPDLVAGVWTGNSDNSPMSNIFSTTIAWPAWRDFMAAALKTLNIPSKPFERPADVVEKDLCWPSGRLPSALCPTGRIVKGLMATEAIPTDKDKLAKIEDTWWQRVTIDTRTGLLAAPNTPAVFTSTETRLVFPKEEQEAWEDMRDWAQKQNVLALLAPSAAASESAANALNIQSPVAGQRVTGTVVITGRATSPDFQRYVLEWGEGTAPTSFTPITTVAAQVQNGVLGSWNVARLEDGYYQLRLRITDTKLGELRFAVPVVIGTPASVTPIASIVTPKPGDIVAGTVTITGTASSPGALRDYTIELGTGATPTKWTLLRKSTSPVQNGPLGTIEVAGLGLRSGLYTLRLTVTDVSGASVSAQAGILVQAP
jgi:membrane peptidoglycan carboxypeptidase